MIRYLRHLIVFPLIKIDPRSEAPPINVPRFDRNKSVSSLHIQAHSEHDGLLRAKPLAILVKQDRRQGK